MADNEIRFEDSPDFERLYSNNVRFHSSNWDLELIFGQADLRNGNHVVQHTSMTVPWAWAKLMVYFLWFHVGGHEAEFGRIKIPTGLVVEIPFKRPPEFAKLSEEDWSKIRKHYEEFIAQNPEAAPAPAAPAKKS